MDGKTREWVEKAKGVLEGNHTGGHTMPSASLYPHQWSWDSAFIAIGYSHYATDLAMAELDSLFSGQWRSGMVPQIVFDEAKLGAYFPEPDFWRTDLSPDAPDDTLTSGITMPPIHAYGALKIYKNAGEKDKEKVKAWLKGFYPKLVASHRYLYRERDPDGTGLVYIRHPWESGMDNSPMWDTVLRKIDLTEAKLPEYTRRDLASGVDPSTRPKGEEYDRFVWLVDLFRRLGYDETAIRAECPYLLYGPLFNSILCASNEALIEIASIIGEETGEAERWLDMTTTAIRERLWHGTHGTHDIFDFYDITTGALIDIDSAAGFMPLFGGAATGEQAKRVYRYLESASFCSMHEANCFSIPNFDTRKEGFDRANYWRGPVWINVNWMLMEGLKRYGFDKKAMSVGTDIVELVMRSGFYEYFDSVDGRGYGTDNFSWTAALFIDTAMGMAEEG